MAASYQNTDERNDGPRAMMTLRRRFETHAEKNKRKVTVSDRRVIAVVGATGAQEQMTRFYAPASARPSAGDEFH